MSTSHSVVYCKIDSVSGTGLWGQYDWRKKVGHPQWEDPFFCCAEIKAGTFNNIFSHFLQYRRHVNYSSTQSKCLFIVLYAGYLTYYWWFCRQKLIIYIAIALIAYNKKDYNCVDAVHRNDKGQRWPRRWTWEREREREKRAREREGIQQPLAWCSLHRTGQNKRDKRTPIIINCRILPLTPLCPEA